MALSPEDVQSIVDAVEQLDWVEWVKGQMGSEPTPSIEHNDMAGAPEQPVPTPGPVPPGAPQMDAAPPVPDAAPPAMPAPEAEVPPPAAPADPPVDGVPAPPPPPQQPGEEQKEPYMSPLGAGLLGAGAGFIGGRATAPSQKNSKTGDKQVLYARPGDSEKYEMPEDVPVDDDELEIDIDLNGEEDETDEYEADADIDIDLEEDDEEEVDEYQAALYQALESGSAVEEPIEKATTDADVADPSLMKFSRMRQNLRSERSRYSRLEQEHERLRRQVNKINAEKVAAQRYGKLQSLSFEYSLDLAKEAERCSKMSSEQFEDHLDVISENYSRIPIAQRTPQLFTPDVSAVQTDRYARDTADAAVAHCMREREKGNNISYAEALAAVRDK